MLKRFLLLRPVIIFIYNNTTTDKILKNKISTIKFEYLIIIKKVFRIFVEASTVLQGEYYTTINNTLLYVYSIYKDLKKVL